MVRLRRILAPGIHVPTRLRRARRPAVTRAAATLVALALAALLAGCQTVPLDEHEAALEEIERLSEELATAEADADTRDEAIASLRSEADALRTALVEERRDAAAIRSDLELALEQLGTLREDRLDLRDELDLLEEELEGLRAAARETARADEAVVAAGAAGPGARDSSAGTANDPFAGGGGFTVTRRLGFQNDPRATARLASAVPGVRADTTPGVPVLYDSRLDYEETLVHLSIVDPEGRRPRLELTAQYTSPEEPLYVRTAFITIEDGDPVDPIDPIVLSGEPVRLTDGSLLLESLSLIVDRDLIDRLSTMISSNRFQVTFVGPDDQYTHRPSVAERAALSNMIFAFIDLGGVR